MSQEKAGRKFLHRGRFCLHPLLLISQMQPDPTTVPTPDHNWITIEMCLKGQESLARSQDQTKQNKNPGIFKNEIPGFFLQEFLYITNNTCLDDFCRFSHNTFKFLGNSKRFKSLLQSPKNFQSDTIASKYSFTLSTHYHNKVVHISYHQKGTQSKTMEPNPTELNIDNIDI